MKHKSSDLSSPAQLEDLPGVKEAEQHEESVRVRAGSGMRPAALGSVVCKLRRPGSLTEAPWDLPSLDQNVRLSVRR